MERASTAVGVALACVLLGACSLIESFDGYAGGGVTVDGADAAGVSDAPAGEAADARPSDAGSDAMLVDAGVDATGDGSVADAAQPFCASRSPAPTFCDDFDTHGLDAGWDKVETNGGTPVRDSLASVSAPDSLLVKMNAVPANTYVTGSVDKSFGGFAARPIHGDIGFQMRVEAIDTKNNADSVLADLVMANTAGNTAWSLQFVAQYSTGQVTFALAEIVWGQDGGQLYQNVSLTQPVPLDQWRAVRIHFALPVNGALPNGANVASVYFDEQLVGQLTLKYPVLPYTPSVQIGPSYIAAPSDPWTVRYDDAWITITTP